MKMNNRFIVRSSFNKRTGTSSFFVRDNARTPERIPGVNTPFSSREEAEYLAWALNINPRYSKVSGRTTFKES